MYTIPEKGTMEEVSKPYGVVTDDCVELVGKDAVSIANKKGLRFKPDLLPTVHPDRGLTLTFWLKVERISVSCDDKTIKLQIVGIINYPYSTLV